MVPHSVVWKLVVTTTASAVVDHFFVEPYIRPQLQKIKPPFGFSSSEKSQETKHRLQNQRTKAIQFCAKLKSWGSGEAA